jgi:hypothetical protein
LISVCFVNEKIKTVDWTKPLVENEKFLVTIKKEEAKNKGEIVLEQKRYLNTCKIVTSLVSKKSQQYNQ